MATRSNNEKLAKSRIKLGLLLNEYGEKNNLKVSDDEIRNEIQMIDIDAILRGDKGNQVGYTYKIENSERVRCK